MNKSKLFFSLFFLLLSSQHHHLLLLLRVVAIDDRLIAPSQSITVNQTLVSHGGVFELGFFSSSNSTTIDHQPLYYLGIWYHNLPVRTIVWVANRDKPLKNSRGKLTFIKDGNLAVVDGNGDILWSSRVNPSSLSNEINAVLLDSGNFVLQQNSTYIWQSFDMPTDTFLPNMLLRSNMKTGEAQRISSWMSFDNPAPGNFSFGIDPKNSLQIVIWQGSNTPHWRSHVWNGKSLSGTRETNATSQYVLKVAVDNNVISIMFSPTQGTAQARYVLEPTGTLKMVVWNEPVKNWSLVWSRPSKPCDSYDVCGPSGYCDSSVLSLLPQCKCFPGFKPRDEEEWKLGNYSQGCVRRVALSCDNGDKFWKMERMKLPDRLTLLSNKSLMECQSECLTSCTCTAYAYSSVTGGGSSQRCLVWVDELMDLEHVSNGGEDLNVRLVASELVFTNSTELNNNEKKSRSLLVIVLPIVAGLILIFGCLCCFLWRRRMYIKGKKEAKKGLLFGDLSGKNEMEIPLLDYNTIMAATNNFAFVNKLGEGGFGPVYKGNLQGQEIAVKKLSKSSGQGYEEFKNEVELIARLQHTNLVRLMGWCMDEDEKLLIYEYLPNKSLDKFLFDTAKSASLDWRKRYQIIEGIAQGLLYLHRYSRLRIIHRDLKTSNILLDGALNPKISDFGLARIFGGNQTEANTKRVVGTYGYMSPEYAFDGVFSEKSDVFSFGVIVLEIVSGKRSTGFYANNNLLGYAWQLWEEGRGLQLLDNELGSSLCASEVMRCIQIGLLCIQENSADRPAMSAVISMLTNDNITLPSPKQPAFAVGRHPDPESVNSASIASIESVNEVTLSVVDAR
ncbi:receptor-like serine/threonine-protein kinase SD1-8 isoform X1 [Dioscorea cayenensis subsp. rotundata]|uniref:Receptor-like serine/threonine-protein kinase n=1 Tax=Dioscorea cayennensis subsp. rotundata TaxID=55577 RepID=A0AB40AKG6_DIOCR|nr:receptor-like serine/threonine-protein kinase SD1-8 isoform X1 [Dioscorea cayenensis subsp. rotundata]